jgi:hypothetical protein
LVGFIGLFVKTRNFIALFMKADNTVTLIDGKLVPAQIGTKAVEIGGERHEVKVFEPVPGASELKWNGFDHPRRCPSLDFYDGRRAKKEQEQSA